MTHPCGHTSHADNTVRLNRFTAVCRECYASTPAKAAKVRAKVERNAEIRTKFAAGTGRAQLSADYRLTLPAISKIIGVENIRHAETAIRDGEIIQRQRAEESLADLAAAFGLLPDRIRVITNAKDVLPPSWRIARNAEIVQRIASGEHSKAIAHEYGMSADYLCDIARRVHAVKPDKFADRALAVAADLAGAKVSQLTSEWRSPKILVQARWATMVALHKRGMSYPQIGKHLGGRDHSTVMYGIRMAKTLAGSSPEFAHMLARVNAA